MKKLLLISGIYPPDIGGPATHVKTLVQELPKNGIKTRVITFGDKKTTEADGDTKIVKISRKQNIFFRYIDFTIAILQNLNWADVIYAQGLVSEGFPTWIACKLKRRKYFLKIVGDYAWEQYKQQSNDNNQSVEEFQNNNHNKATERRKAIQKLVAKGAKLIITPSNYQKNIIKGWGIDGDKIKVIYNAVQSAVIKEGKITLKSELGIKGNIILTAGRLVNGKGYQALIEIMPELLKGNPNFMLVIAGDGPIKSSLEEVIQKLELKKNIFLSGQIDKQKLMRLMKASDMFVLNSEHETMSNVLIEAMGVGVPVIASNRGGNPEIIENDHSGILVEYNDKEKLILNIVKLWHNRMVANDFIINGQKVAKDKFSKENMIHTLTKTLSQ